MRPVYAAYSLTLAVVMAVYGLVAVWRRVATGRPVNARERLGYYRDRPLAGRAAWIHAVSVGEALAAVPLVEGLRRRYPDLPVVVTTVTPTGARVAVERLRDLATHRYFPIDLPGPVRRAIAANRPRFFVALETELWPNLLRALAARGVPVMIANGRISDRSFRRYYRVRRLMRRVLSGVSVLGMRSTEDARRIIALGADSGRVFVTGNVKNDAPDDTRDESATWRRLLGLVPGAQLWIAGSTHRGEEQIVLDAHARLRVSHPGLRLVVAPRHPERAGEVDRLIRARGLAAVPRTRLPLGAVPDDTIVVLDTIGELPQLYRAADVVFVGGSLVPAGGHNMLEPALRRKPVLFGPHTGNFRESAELLIAAGGGLVVDDGDDLAAALTRLLADEEVRTRMGAAGRDAVTARQGALRETLELIDRFLIRPTAA
jgi:3-deoxy-D-manno-octulosonic-acid transferase